ncbi:MAG TPA: ABC transporter substrate-binding protein, partial [Reyranellaceae bacterium]|nr:ABC transporter substrate-binding protein [Reyranellaceae bacterium]
MPDRSAMLRRELLHLGLAAPLVAGPLQRAPAQTLERRRAGILLTLHQTDPEGQARVAAVRMGLGRAGWREGVNIDIDYRWAPNDRDLLQRAAGELVAAKPDVIIAQNTPATRAVLRLTTAIPVVFCQASDPVGSGLVASLARPGGNATGFVDLEASLATKWIELLKEIAPTLRRIAFLYNPATATYAEYYLGRFRAAAPGFGIEPVAAPVHDASEIASVLAAHGRGGTG